VSRPDGAGNAARHGGGSRWYADAGDADRAIEHAIAAADFARAGELLWATAGRVLDGRAADVRRWLQHFTPAQIAVQPALALFTPEQIGSEPTLALTAAAGHLVAGERDLVEHWTAVAERTRAGDEDW